jgi:hypothetical protein
MFVIMPSRLGQLDETQVALHWEEAAIQARFTLLFQNLVRDQRSEIGVQGGLLAMGRWSWLDLHGLGLHKATEFPEAYLMPGIVT